MTIKVTKTCTKCSNTKTIRRNDWFKGDICSACHAKERYHTDPNYKSRVLKREKDRHLANPESKRVANCEWYQKNKESWKAKVTQYRIENHDRVIAKNVEYTRNRRRADPFFRLCHRLRTRLWHATKGRMRTERAIELLGCTAEELRTKLESQFQPGMSWNNYGQWHVDHKHPLSLFDLFDEEQLKKSCHFSNLQPMWASENIRKHNHLPGGAS